MNEGSPSMKIIRRADGRLHVYSRVDKLLSTDDARVKTARLACGHDRRYDVLSLNRKQKMLQCRACTEIFIGE